jgi:hypothetical protein
MRPKAKKPPSCLGLLPSVREGHMLYKHGRGVYYMVCQTLVSI